MIPGTTYLHRFIVWAMTLTLVLFVAHVVHVAAVQAKEPAKSSQGQGSRAYEGLDIVRVKVVGNRRVEQKSILAQVRSKAGTKLDGKRIAADIRRVWRLGYFADILVDAQPASGDKVALTFIVKEKNAVASVRFEGNDGLSEDDIDDVIDIKRFQILDIAKIKANAEKIRNLYVEKGYYLADVTFVIEPHETNADQSRVVFKIHEYAKVQVKRVTFLGNKEIKDEELAQIMATRQGDWFSFITGGGNFKEKAFEADLQRLTAYYYDKGYVQVQVGVPTVRLSKDKRYLFITIKLKEGVRFKVGDVDLQGDFIAKKEKLVKMTSLTSGDHFSYGTLRQDMERLRNFYRNAGFAYVNVNPLTRVDPEEKVVHTTYDIQKGTKVYLGRIEVLGNTKTRDKVIRRELVIEEGRLFSSQAVQLSKQRVQRLGYFEKVEITTQRGARDDVINARVRVVERPTGTFQAGAGFSSAENILANVQVAQNNLFGRGQVLSFQFQWSLLRTLFNLRFSEPYLFDSFVRLTASAYNADIILRDHARTSTGGNLTLGYPLLNSVKSAQDLSLSATYKLENVLITPGGRTARDARQVGSLFRGGLTSSIAASLFYDSRDSRLFPRSGGIASLRAEFADDVFTGSQSEFLKYDAELRWYFPIFWQFVSKLNVKMGQVANIDANKQIPLQERYFVGGPDTVRGFRRFSLGPSRTVARDSTDPATAATKFELGGDKQLLMTAEVEFPILAAINLRGVVFADAGNAFGEGEPYTLALDIFSDSGNDFNDALRTSVGFGFRWLGPIGLLRFEWALPLRQIRGDEVQIFELNIGQGF